MHDAFFTNYGLRTQGRGDINTRPRDPGIQVFPTTNTNFLREKCATAGRILGHRRSRCVDGNVREAVSHCAASCTFSVTYFPEGSPDLCLSFSDSKTAVVAFEKPRQGPDRRAPRHLAC